MRALVYACLSKDTSDEATTLMEELGCHSVAPQRLLKSARAILREQYGGSAPTLLDMFGGGGTIPFEGINVGADTYAVDSNELAVFIQKSCLEYPMALKRSHLADDVEASGHRVLQSLERETLTLFPLRNSLYTYLWTYLHSCNSCGYFFILSKRPWVSRKNGKRLAFEVHQVGDRDDLVISEVEDDYKFRSVWVGRRGGGSCPRCNKEFDSVSIKDCKDELVGVVGPSGKTGKVFSGRHEDAEPPRELLDEIEAEVLMALGIGLPTSSLPRWSGIVNPALYGIDTHCDIFNKRQRVVALLLIKALRQEYDRLCDVADRDYARAVTALLSGLIDQHIDWNCRLSMWISQNEQVGRAFCGPGVAMMWDYAETDPVSSGPSNLWSKLNRIVAGVRSLAELGGAGHIQRGCAQELPFQDEFFDAIVTDPPYYDNIYYNVLADFFFAWKRMLLEPLEPSLFTVSGTDCSRELVASTFRSGDAKSAHEDYCIQLNKAVCEAERVLKTDGVFALLYSHSSLKGWEALALAYRRSSFLVTSVQPLSIERKQRPRAMTSEAVNTCVVFVSHKGAGKKPVGAIGQMCSRVRISAKEFKGTLERAGWASGDIAIAAYAQSVGLLANVSKVKECSDNEALQMFEETVQEEFPAFSVKTRKSL